jgi:tetratricopeptide (TPR) repeat protein
VAKSSKIPGAEVIHAVQAAYERGQTVDALRHAESFAPLKEWSGINECVLAARIAANAGAPRLASRLSMRAWRMDKNHPVAQLQFGFELLEKRGPLALWLAMRRWPANPAASPEQQADLLALQACAAGDLRDFATAEHLLDRAESLESGKPWIHLQRSHLLESQDRVEEALEVATVAVALHAHPFYRPGVQARAHLLQLLDRDEEAIELLRAADGVLQNGPVALQLYALLSETGRWQEAAPMLDRFVALSPLLEAGPQKWGTAQRARTAYHLGKRAEAARFAETLDDDFHKEFAAKLSGTPADSERVQLEVSFVRQHFKTCAPATLAALGRFWRMPAEHLKLAEAICYDGTPHWQQRQWAEQNGWLVREFRVTHETVQALIARGIPFAISTVEATASHMQAVAGFDRTRGTLLLRDPGQPYTVEVPAGPFLKRYRPFGPHGMVFLPIPEGARLQALRLPDAELYEVHHRFWVALAKHDRADAAENLQQMESLSAEHALTWEARLDLASYDANNSEQARCLDKLLELFPNNAARQLRRFGCLRDAPREERIKFLKSACTAKETDPSLHVELARALAGDARSLPQARRWLKRAMRFRPLDPSAISALAELCWEDGDLDEATELYRFAANLESFRENFYQSWFIACRRTRRTEEAMAHLQDRFARFGRRSEQPALTLAWALREVEQPARAREVLDEASRLRPNDGYLLLRNASLAAGLGDTVEADRLLNAARTQVRENDWLRSAAEIAEIQLDTAAALRWAREILRLEPLALDAHGGVARALAQLESSASALAHLRNACAEFPHHYGLQRLLVDWSREAGPEAAEAAARALLRVDPSDAWSRRELAVALTKLNRGEEALREAEESARIEPRNSFSYSVLGHIHRQLGQLPEARIQFRHAVELSVDNHDALAALVELAQTDKERKEELTFIEQQLIQQVVAGDGPVRFLELARPILQPEVLLKSLRQAHAERPDLWHAWGALVSQLAHLNQLDEALTVARQATERFSHVPRAWLDLATVHQWRNERELEIAAAQRAFEMNPTWPRTTLALANAYERSEKLEEARRIYERALQHCPNDPQLHACHAHVLWRLRQKDASFAAVERALRLAPGYDWAWALLQAWASEAGEPERTAGFARTLTRDRLGETRTWLMLARVLNEPAGMPERLAAVERSLALDGRLTEAWDLKAQLLTAAERFDEAIQICREGAAVCSHEVHVLQGRHAGVEARRRQFPEAVRLMRAVLAENSSYAWGWDQLAEWLTEQKSLADAAAALEQLLRLRPHDPWVNRQLGFLRLQQKDDRGATKAFAAALQLEPSDVAAAHSLFDLRLQAADLAGAAATLRVMQTHQPGAGSLAAQISLLLRQDKQKDALKALEALCSSPDPDAWPIDAAVDAFKRAGASSMALKTIKRALKSKACNPQSATAAIRLLLGQGRDVAALWLFLRLKPGEAQRRATAPLVQGLAELKSKILFRWLLWRRREVLARDAAAWGQVGYAMSTFGRMKEVARWLADWRSRPEVQPWMLFNYCLALRHLSRYEEATTVARHVLQTWGHREGLADLRLFLAVEDALAGDIPSALLHIKLANVRENVAHDQELLALAKALVKFLQTPAEERAKRFKSVRTILSERFATSRMPQLASDVRRTFRRAGKVFVREGGGWRAKLWFGWKLNWQWLPGRILMAWLLFLLLRSQHL